MRLVELPIEEKKAVLREYPRQIPGGVGHFKHAHGISGDPESFASIATQLPVFRLDPVPEEKQ